ncbi:hypothetical protein ACTA71_010036 [Dictyostelium dimigraforme]
MKLILLLVIFVIFIYLYKNKNRKREINSKIPGPIGLPILGNLLSLNGNIHLKLQEWFKKYGNVFYIRMGNVDTIVLTGYPTLRKAFIENSSKFSSRFVLKSRLKLSNHGENITTENGEKHAILKKIVLSELTPIKIKKNQSLIMEEIEKLFLVLDKHAEDGKPFLINNYFSMFSMNLMLRLLFNVEYPYTEDENDVHENIKNIREFFKIGGKPFISDFIDIPFLKNKRDNVFYQAYEKTSKECKKLIEQYQLKVKEQNNLITDKDAIVSKLIDEFYIGNITWKAVVYTIVDLIIGGSDTSSSIILFSIIEIINNNEIQMKVYNNIKLALNENDENVLLYNKYRLSIPYIMMIIKETYRKYPAALIGIPHITTEDVSIEGHKIAAGTQIIQNIYASQRCDQFFKNPDIFNPERFEENKNNDCNSQTNLLNFGIGVRDCIGKTFADFEIFTLLGSLINRYEFVNPNPLKKLCDDFIFGITMLTPNTKVILKRRK